MDNPFTFHNLADATAIAEANNAGDEDGWTYEVVAVGKASFTVAVHDEDNFVVGYL